MLARFWRELEDGKSLSYCLELYDTSFSEAEVWIIKSWEKTGNLNTVLTELADQIEKVDSMSWKIKWAMIYPFFIMLVVVWVVSIMMTMVVPKLLDIFDDKSSLPTSTKMLMWISDVFQSYRFLFLLIIIGITLFVFIWKKTPDGKYVFDNLLLKIPIFWAINRKTHTLEFFSCIFWSFYPHEYQ